MKASILGAPLIISAAIADLFVSLCIFAGFLQRAAMLALQALYWRMAFPPVHACVRPSVCYTPVLCQNDGT